MYKRRFSRFPRRKILRRRRGLAKKRVPKSIRRYVKKAIHRQIENKQIIDYATNMGIISQQGAGTFNGTSNGRYLTLAPTQGTGDNQRIGNEFKIVKGIVKGRINLLSYDATYNNLQTPVIVKMWLVKQLDYRGTQSIGALTNFCDNFFRGNGTPLPMQGNLLDTILPINNDLFRVLATKQFELGATYASATGAVGSGGYFDNSKMSLPFYFNWGKYCKKVLKVNDSGLVTNDNCYIIFQAVRADGYVSGTNKLVEYHLVNDILFEDA